MQYHSYSTLSRARAKVVFPKTERTIVATAWQDPHLAMSGPGANPPACYTYTRKHTNTQTHTHISLQSSTSALIIHLSLEQIIRLSIKSFVLTSIVSYLLLADISFLETKLNKIEKKSKTKYLRFEARQPKRVLRQGTPIVRHTHKYLYIYIYTYICRLQMRALRRITGRRERGGEGQRGGKGKRGRELLWGEGVRE
jgi:hypothetical protein